MSAPAATLLCGVWSQIYIATWGAMMVAVDPFTGWQAGSVSLRVVLPVDVFVSHPETFKTLTGVN
jgi:hypothetical protein